MASDEELAAANSFLSIAAFGSTAIGFAGAGLLASIDLRIASCSSSSSSSATAPFSDEKVCQSIWTATRSSYRVTAQNPWLGAGSGCQITGASRRSSSNHSNGIRST